VNRGKVSFFFAKVENIDATYKELKERGAKITEDIEYKPWNIRQFAVEDLNGHIF